MAVLACAFLIGSGVGFAGTTASAGTASGTVGAWNTYQNYATIYTSPGRAYAGTAARTANGSNAPTGYLGARGRLFANGSTVNIQCEGTTVYNSVIAREQNAYSCTRYQGGVWNSYGVTRFYWNGGYSDVMTYNSPNQSS